VGAALAVAVPARLLGRQAEEDGCGTDDNERSPNLRAIIGEVEDPRRRHEKGARHDVDQVVHRHRGDLPNAELVVRDQAVGDQAGAEHDRDHGRAGVV
jgi:hypothetical protein